MFFTTHSILKQAVNSGKSAEDASELGQINENIAARKEAINAEVVAAKPGNLARLLPTTKVENTTSSSPTEAAPTKATTAIIDRVKEAHGSTVDDDVV